MSDLITGFSSSPTGYGAAWASISKDGGAPRRSAWHDVIGKKVKKAGGVRGVGAKRILKKAKKDHCQRAGVKGGVKRAGKGRDEASVKNFERWSRKHYDKHGIFPSWSLCFEKHRASKNLWARVKANVLHGDDDVGE